MSYMSEWKRLLLFLYHSELYQLSILIFLSLQAIHCLARTISDGKKKRGERRRKSKIENLWGRRLFCVVYLIWFDFSEFKPFSLCSSVVVVVSDFLLKIFFLHLEFVYLPHPSSPAHGSAFLISFGFTLLPLRAESDGRKERKFLIFLCRFPEVFVELRFPFREFELLCVQLIRLLCVI